MYLLKIDNLENKVSNRILRDVLKWMYHLKIDNLDILHYKEFIHENHFIFTLHDDDNSFS